METLQAQYVEANTTAGSRDGKKCSLPIKNTCSKKRFSLSKNSESRDLRHTEAWDYHDATEHSLEGRSQLILMQDHVINQETAENKSKLATTSRYLAWRDNLPRRQADERKRQH